MLRGNDGRVQGMFRRRDPQTPMFEVQHVLPKGARARLEKTWAQVFRDRGLALIEEEPFAGLYDAGKGRPNVPVQIVLSVLILKELFNLTDMEALEQLEFNLLWQHALRLEPGEVRLCQKTLHNFRAKLIEHDAARLAFERVTARLIEALGIRVNRQRLDSTHVLSNIALTTRLGLFCETLRVALAALRSEHPKLFQRVPEELRGRHLRDDGDETRFRDVKSDEARRRLGTCAQDVYRVLKLCEGKAAAKLHEIEQLQRLFDDQCKVVEGEAGEGDPLVVAKDPRTISSSSLQTPHDPDVTYSGHKGKGYEVQIAETCNPDDGVNIITHVSVTPSCQGDAGVTIPVLADLADRGLQPDELIADGGYGSAANALEAERQGTELVSPVVGADAKEPEADAEDPENRRLTDGDFKVAPDLSSPAVCPAGFECRSQRRLGRPLNTVELRFDASNCATCPLASRCPATVRPKDGDAVVRVDLVRANLQQRRRLQARGELKPRYRIRAGIESTNSELKRRHGLGKLRVRGKERVRLATYFKALACNIKRMIMALRDREGAMAAA